MSDLTEENYVDVINGYSREQWQPLLDLIPELAQNVARYQREKTDELVRYFEEVERRFSHLMYDMPLIVVFDWPHWEEGGAMVKNPNFDYNTIDIPTKCKLLTAFVRSDRFNDGLLYSVIVDGTVLKILKSIVGQLGDNSRT